MRAHLNPKHIVTVGIAIVTRSPFLPWKRTMRVVTEAKARGLEVGIALDPRDIGKPIDLHRLRKQTDTFIWHKAPKDSFCERGIGELQEAMRSDLILRVDDDEEPSRTLWDDLDTLGAGTAYTIPILCYYEGRLYVRGMEKQVRIFPRGAFHFAGGMDSEMVVDCPLEERPLDILWHYSLYASLEERKAKARRLARLAVPDHFATRFMWEDNKNYFVDLPEGMAEELPRDEKYVAFA